MSHALIHIYGPFAVEWYGLMIFLAILTFVSLVYFDERRKKIITSPQLFDCITLASIVGVVGGRLLFVATNWSSMSSLAEVVAIYDGGFSLLGSVVGIALFLPLYAWRHAIPILRLCDLFAIYAPLVISISRIGCFMAGCCYGTPCDAWFCVIYKDGYAPVGILLHPTQLYSAFMLFLIFLCMRFCIPANRLCQGQLMMIFLIFICIERFFVDFWRADRELIDGYVLSIHQYVSLGIIVIALIGALALSFKGSKTYESL